MIRQVLFKKEFENALLLSCNELIQIDQQPADRGPRCGFGRRQVGRPLEEVTPDEWHDIFAVNVTGAFYFAQAAVPGMKAARYGRIVNMSSVVGAKVHFLSRSRAVRLFSRASVVSTVPAASPRSAGPHCRSE